MTEVLRDKTPEPNDWQKKGMARLKWASLGYLPGLTLLGLSAPLGLAPTLPVALIIGLALLVGGMCWLLIQSNMASPHSDPMWVFPQVCTGYVIVALSFAFIPWTRTVACAWLFVIVAFDLRRLNRWQTWTIAVLWASFPIWSLTVRWHESISPQALKHEWVFTILSLILVPSLFYISALARRLRRRHKGQQIQMAEVLARLRKLSAQDTLTGLYNRGAMQKILRKEVLRTQRSKLPFALALLDLDHFKKVNDQFGHAVGDEVLRQFGELLKSTARSGTDVTARWGGEEFMMFLPATTESEASILVDRLRHLVQQHPWFRIHPQLAVTVSAGIALHSPNHALEDSIRTADQALYQAKGMGRNQTVLNAQAPSDKSPLTEQAQPPLKHPTPPSALDNGWLLPQVESAKANVKSSVLNRCWLTRLIFGTDESLHTAVQLALVGAGLYLSLILAFALYGIPTGLVSKQLGLVFITADLFAGLTPLILVRSGLARTFNDPSLSLIQILFGCVLCALAFATIPESRAYDLQLLCITLAFGLANINPRQAIFVGGFVTVIFMGIYIHETKWAITGNDTNAALRFQLLMAATIVWLLTLQMRHHCLIRQGVTQEKMRLLSAMEQLRQAIKFDPLTHLYNRSHIESILHDEALRHNRTGVGFCIALIDIDHFKNINDQLGHQVGDTVLKRFASCSKELIRETDTLGRWGGEEFILVVPDTNGGPEGLRATERLRQHISQQALCDVDTSHNITFSAGVAIHQRGESIQSLLDRADSALYAAKEQGRNRSVLSSSQ